MKHKKKNGRKLLSVLLALALVLGLMPGMGLTAYATETPLTTITATGKEQASYSTANVANVSFSYTTYGSSEYLANWGWWGYGWIATVTPADGYTITECVFYDNENRTATDSEAPFVVETTEEDKTPKVNGTPILAVTSKGIKKIEVYGYVNHNFTYSASGATITATCSANSCTLPPSTEGGTDHVATLTIAAPTLTTVGGTGSAEATITDENSIKGDAKVMYQTKSGETYGTATETAPTGAGDHKASITLGTEGNTATASVEYTINKADPTAPTGLTATYGQKLSDVGLPTGWTWVDSTQGVGSVVSPAAFFKANFAGNDNYNSKSNVDVAVTVSKADATTAMQTASVSIAGTSGKTATVSYALPDGASYGAVTNSNTEFFTVDTTSGIVLTAAKNWTASDWATDTSKTFTVLVSGATNYNDYTLTATVTPTYKATQTITAADVTATYGDTNAKIEATTTSGSGTLSYAVKSGEAVTVNENTGALTIVKAGSAVITVTAAETATYAQATKDVNVTINKANAVAASVTANNRTYDGTEKPLVTVTGEPTGGEMQYALGTATEATQPYTTSIPTATNAGTYYVWYKVVGDDDHTDTEPACVTATIEENGSIEPVVDRKDNTPKAEVEGLDEDLAKNVMNDDEKNKVKSGEKATLTLEMTNIDSSVPQEDKTLTENILSSSTARGKVGMYLDFSLWLRIGADYSRQLSETGGKQITVKLEVPEKLRAPAGVTRKFFIFHIHKGAAKKLAETTNNTIPITVGEFSTFVLAYEDEEIDASTGFYSGLKISQKNGKIKVSWDKGEDASKYAVYAAYCGKEFASKPVKTTKSTSATFKKINGKKIDFSKNLKIYVTAYDASGKKIGNTVSAHFAGKNNKKYKNPKAVKLTTTALTIEVGKSAKVKASVKMESGKKKALDDAHGAKLRYKTTNEKIATVDKNGKVTGVAAGTCEVYVYSRNGLAKKCTVTVK